MKTVDRQWVIKLRGDPHSDINGLLVLTRVINGLSKAEFNTSSKIGLATKSQDKNTGKLPNQHFCFRHNGKKPAHCK